MVFLGRMRPGQAIEDIREEIDLSPERANHIACMVNNGLLNRDDVRSMMSRKNLASAHGIDVLEWPSLRDAARPKQKRLPQPLAFQSHRGEGAIPALGVSLRLSSSTGVSDEQPGLRHLLLALGSNRHLLKDVALATSLGSSPISLSSKN